MRVDPILGWPHEILPGRQCIQSIRDIDQSIKTKVVWRPA